MLSKNTLKYISSEIYYISSKKLDTVYPSFKKQHVLTISSASFYLTLPLLLYLEIWFLNKTMLNTFLYLYLCFPYKFPSTGYIGTKVLGCLRVIFKEHILN